MNGALGSQSTISTTGRICTITTITTTTLAPRQYWVECQFYRRLQTGPLARRRNCCFPGQRRHKSNPQQLQQRQLGGNTRQCHLPLRPPPCSWRTSRHLPVFCRSSCPQKSVRYNPFWNHNLNSFLRNRMRPNFRPTNQNTRLLHSLHITASQGTGHFRSVGLHTRFIYRSRRRTYTTLRYWPLPVGLPICSFMALLSFFSLNPVVN